MNVLIVALDAVPPTEALEGEILVVVPALVSGLHRWLSDEDEARRRAEQLARTFVELLGRHGVEARGRAGDADPLLATADALATFPADEIVIVGRSERLRDREKLVSRMRRRFELPVRDWDSVPLPQRATRKGWRSRPPVDRAAGSARVDAVFATRRQAEAQR